MNTFNLEKTWEKLSEKVPMVIAFVLGSIILFFINKDTIGTVFGIVAVVHSFLIFRSEHYEKIIKQKDGQIAGYIRIDRLGQRHMEDTLNLKENSQDLSETRIK
jgi:hypothetical protein